MPSSSPSRSMPWPTDRPPSCLTECMGEHSVTDLDDCRRPTTPADRVEVGPAHGRGGRRRRGGAGVQLGNDRAPQGRPAHPPVDRLCHRALVPDPRPRTRTTGSRWPRPPRTSSDCSTCWPRHRPVPPCACTGGSTSTRSCAASPAERMTLEMAVAPIALAMANHPDLERFDLSSLRYIMWGATPVSEHVARTVTERSGVRWLPAYGASEVPVIAVNPVERPGVLAARLGRAAARGRGAARGRPRHRCHPAPGGDRGDPGAEPVGHGRLPARGGDRGRLLRRLVPDRGRGLAGGRGLGPPHRPLQGDDQGQRIPGGPGRDRRGPARAPGRARLRGLRPGRRAGRRGARRRRPARIRRRPSPRASSRRSWPLRWPPTSSCATSSSSTPFRGFPSGKVLRRTLRDEWTPVLTWRRARERLMDVRLSPEQQALRHSAAQVVDRLGPRTVRRLDDAERAGKLDAAVVASGWRELRVHGATAARRSPPGWRWPSSPKSSVGAWPTRPSSARPWPPSSGGWPAQRRRPCAESRRLHQLALGPGRRGRRNGSRRNRGRRCPGRGSSALVALAEGGGHRLAAVARARRRDGGTDLTRPGSVIDPGSAVVAESRGRVSGCSPTTTCRRGRRWGWP